MVLVVFGKKPLPLFRQGNQVGAAVCFVGGSFEQSLLLQPVDHHGERVLVVCEKKQARDILPRLSGTTVDCYGLQQIGFLKDNNGSLVRDNQHQQPAYEQNCIHGLTPFLFD